MTDNLLDVQVQVPGLDEKVYTYRLPSGFPFSLPYAAKVRVPFGPRSVDGFVVGEGAIPLGVSTGSIKAIESVYDLQFLPPDQEILLAKTLSRHYAIPISAALALMWPPFAKRFRIDAVSEELASSWRELVRSRQELGEPNTSSSGENGSPKDIRSKGLFLIVGSRAARWSSYVEEIKKTLSIGEGVLVLVPEIKGIERALESLCDLKDQTAVLHSELTGAARRDSWEKLNSGEKRIGLGARSAVFAPISNLGLIIMDEEESTSYKSEDYPRYNGRNVAMMRSPRVIFGSSHPSVWAYRQVLSGNMSMIRKGVEKPEVVSVEVIDLKKHKTRSIFAPRMIACLEEVFSRGEKALLFLPRRGDASFVVCQDCGNIQKCPRCSLPLSYHAEEKAMVCHTCGRREPPLDICPACGSYRWKFSGPGIERAQAEFTKRFPSIPCYRLDQDVLKKRPLHEVLSDFARNQASCLLSTQAILGYGPIPRVGVIGVLSIDVLFSLPDYRASENVFLTLRNLMGLFHDEDLTRQKYFLIQTKNSRHHAILGLLSEKDFYDKEIEERSQLKYPPCGYFAKIECYGTKEDKIRTYLLAFAQTCETLIEDKGLKMDVLGPSPERKPKVRGKYRWSLALKTQDLNNIVSVYKEAMKKHKPSGLTVVLDLDDPVM